MLDLAAAFATFPVLKSERFILRAITPDDAADMFRVMSDPQVMRYFGRTPMATLAESVQRAHDIQRDFGALVGVRWAITRQESDQCIGTCGFWRIDKNHFRAEVGYELAPEWWGQRVMPEALAAALTFGFTTMGLHSAEAQIDPDNTASRRVLEKLGFVQEAYFRENYYLQVEGRFSDTAVFSLLGAAWLGRNDS